MASFGTPVKNNNNNNELVVKKRRSTSTKGTPTHKLRKFVISNNKNNEIYSSSSNKGNSKLIAKILTGKSSRISSITAKALSFLAWYSVAVVF